MACLHLQSWLLDYNAQHLSLDCLSFLAGFVSALSTFAKVPLSSITKAVVFLLLGIVHQSVVLFLIFRRQRSYIRWRSTILITHLIIRSLEYHFMAVNTPEYHLIHPLKMPSEPRKAAAQVLFGAITLVYNIATVMLPVRRYQFLASYSVPLFIFQSFERCKQEMDSVPGQGERYRTIVKTIEYLIAKSFVAPTTYPSSLPIGAVGLSDRGTCIAVHSSALVSEGNKIWYYLFNNGS